MNTLILNLIIYVPYVIASAIIGTLYFISGYKKGWKRALLSLGITVACVVLSLIISNLLSTLIAGPVMKLFPGDAFEGMGAFNGFAMNLVQGIIKAALSIILFGFFLLISIIVLKIIGNKIKPEIFDMKETEGKKSRLLGMGIRAVDTVIVSLMLLLPLYGSLSIAMPMTATVTQTSSDSQGVASNEESGLSQMIATVENHPMVAAYSAGPCEWVMSGLTDLGSSNGGLDLVQVSETLDEVINICEKLASTNDEEEIKAGIVELCAYLKKNVVNEKWCYEVVCAAKDQLESELKKADPAAAAEISDYLDILDMTRDEFQSNANAILDFVPYAMTLDIDAFREDGNYSLLPDEFYEKLGALLNVSPQARALKKVFYVEAAKEIYYDLYRNENDNMITEGVYENESSDSDKALEFATKFVNKYFKDGSVSKKDYAREAEAFLLAAYSNNFFDSIDAFVRHPLFGAESVKDFVSSDLVLSSIYGYYSPTASSKIELTVGEDNSFYATVDTDQKDEYEAYYKNNTVLTSYMHKGLKAYEGISVCESRYSEYLNNLLSIDSFNIANYAYVFQPVRSGKASEMLTEILGKEYFTSPGFKNGEVMYQLINYAGKSQIAEDIDICMIYKLIANKGNSSFWPDNVLTIEDCGDKYSTYDPSTGEHTEHYEHPEIYEQYNEYSSFKYDLSCIVENQYNSEVLIDLIIKDKGSDPYGIGSSLSSKEKKALVSTLNNIKKSLTVDINSINFDYDGAVIVSSSSMISLDDGSETELILRLADGSTVTVNDAFYLKYQTLSYNEYSSERIIDLPDVKEFNKLNSEVELTVNNLKKLLGV